MKLKTTFQLKPFPFKISYEDKLLFLGSCFAENISEYFEKYRFPVVTNPFGVLFNPLAIHKSIDIASQEKYDFRKNTLQYNNVWLNLDAHSSLSASTEDLLLMNLNLSKNSLLNALEQSSVIFISLGTAWVYKYLKNDSIVANCHKIPQAQFEKKLLEIDEVISSINQMINTIRNLNPNIKIVFTLSPVRHLKDGFVENQLSKSTLHIAIQQSLSINNNVYYFPSYEILLDDLRDYRFYKEDFIHPNSLALQYIWESISDVFFDQNTLSILNKIEKINKRLSHKFFDPNSEASQLFTYKTEQLISELKKQNPLLKF